MESPFLNFMLLCLVALAVWIVSVGLRREPVVPLVGVVAVLSTYICLVTIGVVEV